MWTIPLTHECDETDDQIPRNFSAQSLATEEENSEETPDLVMDDGNCDPPVDPTGDLIRPKSIDSTQPTGSLQFVDELKKFKELTKDSSILRCSMQ
jgi:hypothetical protein